MNTFSLSSGHAAGRFRLSFPPRAGAGTVIKKAGSAKLRAAEAGRASGWWNHPAAAMAGLRDARREVAFARAEFAFVVNLAGEGATAPEMRPVFHVHSVGIDYGRRGTRRDQQNYGGNLAHEPSSRLVAQS
jgi:hypothetical protein